MSVPVFKSLSDLPKLIKQQDDSGNDQDNISTENKKTRRKRSEPTLRYSANIYLKKTCW